MILEEKIKFRRAIIGKKSIGVVYESFNKYEEAYLRLHNPSTRHKKEYIDMYVLFEKYMEKNKNEK